MSVLGTSHPDAQVDPAKAEPPKETPPVNTPEGSDQKHPLNDLLYPKADAPKAEPDKAKPKAGETPPAAKPAEKPAETTPADKRGKSGEEGKPAQVPAKPVQWDKQRQKVDQLSAGNRELKDRLTAVTKTLSEMQTTQREQVTAAETAKREQAAAEVDKLLGSLDADSDTVQMAEALKAVRGLADRAPVTGDSPDVTALKQQVEDMQQKLDRREADDAADAEEKAEEKADTDWDAFLTRMDTQYGAQHRAKALENASEHFAQRGYTEEKGPDSDATFAQLELEYTRLVAAAGADTPPKPGTEVVEASTQLDTGAGGGVAADAEGGTLEEVAADMRTKGKFNNMTWPPAS